MSSMGVLVTASRIKLMEADTGGLHILGDTFEPAILLAVPADVAEVTARAFNLAVAKHTAARADIDELSRFLAGAKGTDTLDLLGGVMKTDPDSIARARDLYAEHLRGEA